MFEDYKPGTLCKTARPFKTQTKSFLKDTICVVSGSSSFESCVQVLIEGDIIDVHWSNIKILQKV